MRGPYGFELSESCQTCKLRGDEFFCQLSAKALKDLDQFSSPSAYPAGAILFIEEQDCRGIFVLCEGKVKLSICSNAGKTMILKIAQAGEVLGLSAILAGRSYETTAETLHPCQVVFIPRDEFLRFLAHNPEASQNMVKQLSAEYQSACNRLRTVGLSASASRRLAKFLLDWRAGSKQAKSDAKTKISLTHTELAQCIGTTRETVTRTLSDFRNRRLVTLRGATLAITNRAALESFVSYPRSHVAQEN